MLCGNDGGASRDCARSNAGAALWRRWGSCSGRGWRLRRSSCAPPRCWGSQTCRQGIATRQILPRPYHPLARRLRSLKTGCSRADLWDCRRPCCDRRGHWWTPHICRCCDCSRRLRPGAEILACSRSKTNTGCPSWGRQRTTALTRCVTQLLAVVPYGCRTAVATLGLLWCSPWWCGYRIGPWRCICAILASAAPTSRRKCRLCPLGAP